MKSHPTSKILIEKQDGLFWRVVDRETTSRGFSANRFSVVEENIPHYPRARYSFEEVKGLLKPGP